MSRYGINYYNLAYYGPDNASQYIARRLRQNLEGMETYKLNGIALLERGQSLDLYVTLLVTR
jgi:hypothetical protein